MLMRLRLSIDFFFFPVADKGLDPFSVTFARHLIRRVAQPYVLEPVQVRLDNRDDDCVCVYSVYPYLAYSISASMQ